MSERPVPRSSVEPTALQVAQLAFLAAFEAARRDLSPRERQTLWWSICAVRLARETARDGDWGWEERPS